MFANPQFSTLIVVNNRGTGHSALVLGWSALCRLQSLTVTCLAYTYPFHWGIDRYSQNVTNFDWAALNTSGFNLNETKFKDFNREENKALTLRDF